MTSFVDTNILVYAVTDDPRGALARDLLQRGGVVSVQVLNEFMRVARRKLRIDWPVVETALASFRDLLDDVRPLTLATHEAALALARREGFDIYDALIVAAALEAGCDTLYSEDLQTGRRFGALTIVDPFAG